MEISPKIFPSYHFEIEKEYDFKSKENNKDSISN